MFGFQVRNRQNAPSDPTGSPSTPAAAVGEIDTKAPFESVKAAVNLFVEASPKADTCRPQLLKKSRTMEESVLGKEAQLHWILKEIDKYKEHVKSAESTKGQALGELVKANNTLQELTNKIEAANHSKQASVDSTEAAKTRAQQLEQLKSTKTQETWQQESLDNERSLYKDAANQLISAKQQLTNLRQDFDIALEAKLAYFQQAAEAQHSAKLNRNKITQLSKDIHHMTQTLERVKSASLKAEEDHARLMEEKDALLDSKNKAKDHTDLQIQSLIRKEAEDPAAGNCILQKKLEETTEAVHLLRDQLKGVRAADMELLRNVNSELDEAKRRLEEMKEEETSLRGEVESLKQELENVTRDISLSKEEDLKNEQLQAELGGIKLEVEEAVTKETIAANHVQELESKIREMFLEAEKARQEEEQVKKQVETLWREAQRSELAIKQAEEKLEMAQREVEQAEAAKELADDQIRKRSSSSSFASSSTTTTSASASSLRKDKEKDLSTDHNTIILTTKDFEALSKKAEEATTSADTKVEAIMSQLESIKQQERGILEKLEKSIQENKEIEAEITKAQKAVEVADAARQSVETELNKWRQETKLIKPKPKP